MSSSIVKQRSVSFINSSIPAALTTKDLDLTQCYKEDQVVIKIHSAALNPADFVLHQIANKWIASKKLKTYGMDYSGEIIKRGKKVNDKWQIGDFVNGCVGPTFNDKGTLSDYIILTPSKDEAIMHMKSIDYLDKEVIKVFNQFDINASYPVVLTTAYACLFEHGQKLGPESKILVHGASTAVSNCFVQIAKKYLKVGTVVGVCNSKSLEYNMNAGYDYLFSYNQPNLTEKIKDFVKYDMKGEKFDMIFDSVGTSQYYPIIHDIMKPRKENSYYVSIAGNKKADYHTGLKDALVEFPFKDVILARNPLRSYNYVHPMNQPTAKYMSFIDKMITEKQLIPSLDSVYNIKDFQKAIDRLQSNQAKGKVIIRVNDK